MNFQVSGNRPPKLVKDSYFERWTVAFIEFISSRENGDLMIKSFTEGPLVLYKREEDFSEEEIKQKKADKHALSCLLSVLPQHIYMHVAAYNNNPMRLWNALTKHMLGSKVEFKKREDYKEKIIELTKKLQEMENLLSMEREEKKVDFQKIEENKVEREDEKEKISELSRRLQEVKDLLVLEREDHKKEKEGLVQRIFDLEKTLKMKDKECEDKKEVELKCEELSKQVLDLEKVLIFEKEKHKKERTELEIELKFCEVYHKKFSSKIFKQNSDVQKVLILEKEKLEKERVGFEGKRKDFEVKNGKLSEKIVELQKKLDLQREELEKRKRDEFQAKSVNDDFSVERKIFQQEIQKLTKNLAGLSTDIMKEKRVNCDIRKTLDLMTKERNDLLDKVRSFNKSRSFSGSPIRPSNLFYDRSVDKSSKYYADLPSYKRVNMQWKVKGKLSDKDVPKSSFPNKNFKTKVNSFVNSYCGNYDFVSNNSVQYWYGTFHFPSYRAPLNVSGPKTHWVPKST